ncbi:unnamed protein product, partial [Bubo scandiacus]
PTENCGISPGAGLSIPPRFPLQPEPAKAEPLPHGEQNLTPLCLPGHPKMRGVGRARVWRSRGSSADRVGSGSAALPWPWVGVGPAPLKPAAPSSPPLPAPTDPPSPSAPPRRAPSLHPAPAPPSPPAPD